MAAVAPTITPARPGEIKYPNRRLLALCFDFQGMPTDDQIRAQSAALKFLSTQMTPSDVVAILSYAGELKVLQDFTSDREALNSVIHKLVAGEASEMANTVSDDSAEDTAAAYTADDSEFNIFNTDRQLTALENAVKMLSSLPEKKALVYFASGITRNGIDNDAQLRATINSALRSNVSIYPVDARGLVATAPAGNASRGSAGGRGNFNGGAGRAMAGNMQASQDSMYALAADTGGKAFFDSNDLAGGLSGNIDGLVHLSDISWDVPGEEAVRNYQKGQQVEAMVLSIDPERERISLGVKQMAKDPFSGYVA